MKKITVVAFAALLFAGCAPEPDGAGDVKLALKQADRVFDVPSKIIFLQRAYDGAERLRADSETSESRVAFWKKYDAQLEPIPAEVSRLSIQVRKLEAFKWAVARGIPVDLSRPGLEQLWKCGPAWRDYVMAEHAQTALPVFMDMALRAQDVRFFEKYIGKGRLSDFRPADELEATQFNARLGRFLAIQLGEAVKNKDAGRIGLFLKHTPPLPEVVHADRKMTEVMPQLGDYVFHELRDVQLARRLVGLKYGLGRIELERVGPAPTLVEALASDPKHAVKHVLRLDEWHASLSKEEARFILTLPDESLGLLHPRHVDRAIEYFVRFGESAHALRLIEFRRASRPFTLHEWTKLVDWSLEVGDDALFDYVMTHCAKLNIYNIDLVKLSQNPQLFGRFAPQLFKKVYRTMDLEPRPDGTTLGRLQQVLMHGGHKAGVYIVSRLDLQRIWPEVTEGRTLLMDVCHGGNLPAARYLIEKKGADVQAHTGYMALQTSLFGRSDSTEGRLSAIFFAAAGGNGQLIRYLVSKGARVNSYSAYGATPLMHAVSNNQMEAVKTLIALRADVNAIMNPDTRNLASLQRLGSYDDVATAYRRARKLGNQEIMDMLKKAGARR